MGASASAASRRIVPSTNGESIKDSHRGPTSEVIVNRLTIQKDAGYVIDNSELAATKKSTPFMKSEDRRTIEMRVFVGTWNLHAMPPPADVSEFIPKSRFDLYSIGTEECEQSIEKSILFSSKFKWETQLTEYFGDEFRILSSVTLNAIHEVVFVRKSLDHLISEVEHSSVPTGIGNIVGNKGGVGIGFRLGASYFLFINAHFHAHDKNVEERNMDFHTIDTSLLLRGKNPEAIRATSRFDHVFWAGDLNYRVEGGRKMVDTLLRNQMFEVMLANDQLTVQKAKGRAFKDFKEGEVRFMPTYKFNTGTDEYDTSAKARVPSWTDRVLWKGEDIKLIKYDSVGSIRTSDHRPVYATFSVTTTINSQKGLAHSKEAGARRPSQGCVLQ